MADAALDLVTLDEAKAYFTDIGQTAPADAALGRLITQVSTQFQTYLDRRLVSQAYTATINGRDESSMFAPNYPITAVASVTINGQVIPVPLNVCSSGFVFDAQRVMLRGYSFWRGFQNIVIVYTAGFTTIPADIKAAVFEALSAVIAGQATDDGRAIVIQAGGTKLEFGGLRDQLAIFYTSGVTTALAGYRRVSQGW